MIHLLNKISENDNEKKITIGVFCDLQKAFDCCSHKILLNKLSKLGVRDRELKWFENYLKSREQFFSINDGNSNLRFITKGVPQRETFVLSSISQKSQVTQIKAFLCFEL